MKPIFEVIGIYDGWIRGRIKSGDKQPLLAALGKAIAPKLRADGYEDGVGYVIAVDPSVFDVLIDIATKYCDEVYMRKTADDIGPDIIPDENADPWAAYLKLASNDILKQIDKLMIISLHPDRGGDEERMKKKNIYWDKIKKERGIK